MINSEAIGKLGHRGFHVGGGRSQTARKQKLGDRVGEGRNFQGKGGGLKKNVGFARIPGTVGGPSQGATFCGHASIAFQTYTERYPVPRVLIGFRRGTAQQRKILNT